MYSLALYYLVYSDYTYYGYGTHGNYELGPEKWFDAIDYNIGQPSGQYYIYDDSSGYTQQTQNILINGNFETDNNGDGNPDSWTPAEPVELDSNVKHSGTYSS